ncbi:MAG: HDOD domain-containing protein [Deltaproteobacteria bacterium]|nr:HDOD domain-containing protein [Deltaproteobacteria bacterium]
MSFPLFLFLTVVFLLIIVIQLFPRKKKTRVSRSSHSKMKVPKQSNIMSESSLEQLQNEEAMQCSNAVEPDPFIPEVIYSQMDKETYPTQLEDIDEKIKGSVDRKIALLKPIPMASTKLFDLLKNPNTSTKELTAIIKTNPFLSARILRVINSAFRDHLCRKSYYSFRLQQCEVNGFARHSA